MNLLVEYVNPLINWIQSNPNWALFITFLISLAESLAVVGSIVPGSVTMTAIGILAGSGIMRIDLTLLSATLGAIAGDSLSYALGYFYSDRLIEIWPFSKYPRLLHYGKEFFAAHGGKSVLIGRFVGPLRSIIPVVAGIMYMPHWRFFIANALSAVGWSLLYVLPGVIIGAASTELSTESATLLFVLIFASLAGIWLLGLIIQWLVKVLQKFLLLYLHDAWLQLKNHSFLIKIYNTFTPINEKNHYTTASLALMTLLCILFFIIILVLLIATPWLNFVNLPTFLFFQGLDIVLLKILFIFFTQFTSTLTLSIFFILCSFWFLYQKNYSALGYLFSVLISSMLLVFLITHSCYNPKPSGLLVPTPGSSFPAYNLSIATSLYLFLSFYFNHTYVLITNSVKTTLYTLLGLSGFGSVYLGDYWLTDVLAAYCLGAAIALTHYLIYRKSHNQSKKKAHVFFMLTILYMGILCSSSLATYTNYHILLHNHIPYHQEYTLSEEVWWGQKKPILPIYRFSRVGKRISLLNIQYLGNLNVLQKHLEKQGWKLHTSSFFTNLLLHINKQPNSTKLPLFTQLYLNKAPVLFMTYTNEHSKLSLELRIWEFNYNLINSNRELWIGSIHPSSSTSNAEAQLINPMMKLFTKEHSFVLKQIKIPDAMLKTTKYLTPPFITLIKPSIHTR